MSNSNHNQNFDYQRYYVQSNLVYYNSALAHILLFVVYVWIGHPLLLLSNALALVADVFAIYLNRKARYGFAGVVFIGLITFHAITNLVVLGLHVGFQYYFFNMAALIIFTNWHLRYKLIGVAIQLILFITMDFMLQQTVPIVILSDMARGWFHAFNVLMNMLALGHSPLFYMSAAQQAQQALSLQATTDYLTGVANRNATMESLEKHLYESRKKVHGIGLIMADIDRFKSINDTYGHLVGDAIIRYVSTCLSENLRQEDHLGRYGGEEFIMILKAKDTETVAEIAERMRRKIEEKPVIIDGQPISVTVSFGVIFKKSFQMELSVEQLIDEVDMMLYHSKTSGRNKVSVKEI